MDGYECPVHEICVDDDPEFGLIHEIEKLRIQKDYKELYPFFIVSFLAFDI